MGACGSAAPRAWDDAAPRREATAAGAADDDDKYALTERGESPAVPMLARNQARSHSSVASSSPSRRRKRVALERREHAVWLLRYAVVQIPTLLFFAETGVTVAVARALILAGGEARICGWVSVSSLGLCLVVTWLLVVRYLRAQIGQLPKPIWSLVWARCASWRARDPAVAAATAQTPWPLFATGVGLGPPGVVLLDLVVVADVLGLLHGCHAGASVLNPLLSSYRFSRIAYSAHLVSLPHLAALGVLGGRTYMRDKRLPPDLGNLYLLGASALLSAFQVVAHVIVARVEARLGFLAHARALMDMGAVMPLREMRLGCLRDIRLGFVPTGRQLAALCDSLAESPGVEAVVVMRTRLALHSGPWPAPLTDPLAAVLAALLVRDRLATRVDATGCGLSDAGVASMADALSKNGAVTQVTAARNGLTDDAAAALADVLRESRSIAELDLSDNTIGAPGARRLARALAFNSSLRVLCLRGNVLGDEGTAAIARALVGKGGNRSIKVLDLTRNAVGDVGAEALAPAVGTGGALVDLRLGHNLVSDSGTGSMANALAASDSSLQFLSLYHNAVTDHGAGALAIALRTNRSIRELRLGENRLSDDGARDVALALRVNRSLRVLDLRLNGLGDSAAASVADALRQNATLETVELLFNAVGDRGARSLGNAVKHNTSLQVLSLGFNRMSDSGKRALRTTWVNTGRPVEQLTLY